MAAHGVDDALVYVELMQELVGLHAVLLGPLLEVYVVKYADGAPVVGVLGVAGLRNLAHDLADGLSVLDMEGLGIIALYELERLLGSGNIAHGFGLLLRIGV